MAQNYECVLLLKSTLSDEALQGHQDQFAKIITDHGGEVVHLQRTPKRRLEYAIDKQREAVYAIFYFRADAAGAMVQEFERQVRINDDLLREMTVKVPELRIIDLARLDARPFDDARRGRYGASHPAPAPPAPAQPAEQTPAQPAEQAPPALAAEDAPPPATEAEAPKAGEAEPAQEQDA